MTQPRSDPRVAAVEQNLLTFFAGADRLPLLRRIPADDVDAVRSDVPFPMFNAVTGARFGDDATRRTNQVVDSFVEAGLPWMWWLTPSTTSPEIEATLASRGLEREDVPGMYADLAVPLESRPVDGLAVERTSDVESVVGAMVAGFGMPAFVQAPMTDLMAAFPEAINVIGSLDGRPVATGTAYLTGPTAGLYNIATLPAARGRGVGHAVTLTLMELARAAGAEHAVLHATEAGRPVYERAGFVEVCQVPQYVWMPS
jgi:ribosomal protein S18 acetylase RimI-like enzyme